MTLRTWRTFLHKLLQDKQLLAKMKFSYRLKRVCGNVYGNGNLAFTPDGNSVVSPVGNRLTIFDLVQQSTYTLPFENRKDIACMAMSHNGRFLITVDKEGHALFINLPRQVVLSRFNFKRRVLAIKFSPDDSMFAVTHGHGCQIWCTPSIVREFSPLKLNRTIAGHHDDTTTLDWSSDSESIIMGSKDLSARVYYRVRSKYMAVSVLSGHRDELVGAFFAGADDSTAYTVAVDGAVFTWKFEASEREEVEVPVVQKKRAYPQASDGASDESDSSDSEPEVQTISKRTSKWVLHEREFLWDPHTQVASVDFNKTSNLLLVGFTSGVFGLYEMPGCVNVHRLSVSNHVVNSVTINHTGEWLAIGSAELGQLLVWEWKSESYVLKQQGHLYGLNAMDYSADGQFIATGGEDGKVKIWNAFSGFCFITFSEHIAPVTGVRFVGKGLGKALISASLDGTVRAHDLLRYKNFRTLTTPDPVQFTCLAVDHSGEVVCAGALDPFQIYVWALQTGRLIDVLSGHEGPIACLDFSRESGLLASGSWDGTCKLWDVYKNENTETFEHGCDVLAIAFRPDGQEICTAATNGNLHFWDVRSGSQVCVIEGRHDISGGRLTTDATTAQNAARSKYFSSIAYTADGSCILAGGRSKYVCIYAVATGILVKKFQLSHNRSLEGIVDELRGDRLVDGVALDNLRAGDSDDEAAAAQDLPGQKHSSLKDGSRTTRPEVITSALQFSPTGRDWAVVSTQGLQIFSLDDAMLFAPTDLDVAITPQAVLKAIAQWEFSTAVNMALHLGEREVLKKAVDSVQLESIELVVKTIDVRMLKDLLKFIADEIVASRHTEYYLRWCWHLLHTHGPALTTALNSMAQLESIRALIRAISSHEREIMRMSDENGFSLGYLLTQMVERDPATAAFEAAEMDQEEEEVTPAAAVVPMASPPHTVDEAQPAADSAEPNSSNVTDAEAPATGKKNKKSTKKLTIQTTTGREEILHSLNIQPNTAVSAEDVEPVAEVAEVGEESTFTTPGKGKKDKKSAKSASKSQLRSSTKKHSTSDGEGDVNDEEVMDVPATADRRVSFSQPLSMVKIISPVDPSRRSADYFGTSTPIAVGNGPSGSASAGSNSGKKSSSKKRLWTDDA